jgi:hypothetical protein
MDEIAVDLDVRLPGLLGRPFQIGVGRGEGDVPGDDERAGSEGGCGAPLRGPGEARPFREAELFAARSDVEAGRARGGRSR